MHSNPRAPGYRPATLLACLVALALLAAGCSSAHREATTHPAGRAGATADQAGAVGGDVAVDGEEASAEAYELSVSENEAMDDMLERILEEGPFPGEEVTESPHDALAEVSAELDAARLEHERALLDAMVEPTFDIPMVVNDKVLFWLDYYSNRRHEQFQAGLERSGRYLALFRRIFEEEGLPLDLIYMAHVESAYKTTAYSRARARGIFQFMAATAKRYGLRIDYWSDERLDPEKSARAATAYLKDLYAEFGDWYLALAAYNAGEGKIRSALRRSGRDDFWGIAQTRYIHRETKNYVPAILAAAMISRQPERYGFRFESAPPLLYEKVEIEGSADLQVLARCAGTDLETMKQLNPALRRYQTPPHATTRVRVPVGAGERTLAELAKVPLNERVLYVRHRVRSGDTLSGLARNYGVSVSAIQQANRMGRRTMIRAGQELTIPTVAAGSYPSVPAGGADFEPDSGETVVYRVRRGDNLSAIAGRYRTTAAAIARANGIDVHAVLHPGQRLTVVPGVRSAAAASRIVGVGEPSAAGNGVVHVVRRGESLSSIARRYDTTAQRIAADNGIALAKLLQVGDRLQVSTGPAAGRGAGEADASGSAPVVHTVRRGDSLWRIANRYNTTIESICSLNRISRNARLYPGTRLTIAYD